MEREAVVDYLAALTDQESVDLIAEARGVAGLDAKALIEREFARVR